MPMAEATVATLSAAQVEFVVLDTYGHFWHECPDRFYPRLRAFFDFPSFYSLVITKDTTVLSLPPMLMDKAKGFLSVNFTWQSQARPVSCSVMSAT